MHDIVNMTIAWLKREGYQGLVNNNFGCMCSLDDCPDCGAIYPGCQPAELCTDSQGNYYDAPETTTSAVRLRLIPRLEEIIRKIDTGQAYSIGIVEAALLETAIFRLQAAENKDREKEIKYQS